MARSISLFGGGSLGSILAGDLDDAAPFQHIGAVEIAPCPMTAAKHDDGSPRGRQVRERVPKTGETVGIQGRLGTIDDNQFRTRKHGARQRYPKRQGAGNGVSVGVEDRVVTVRKGDDIGVKPRQFRGGRAIESFRASKPPRISMIRPSGA